jgi:hypothetical protein
MKKAWIIAIIFMAVAGILFSSTLWRTQELKSGEVVEKVYHHPRWEYEFPDYSRPLAGDHSIIAYRTYHPEEFYLVIENEDQYHQASVRASMYYAVSKGDKVIYYKYKSKLLGFIQYYEVDRILLNK